MRLNNLEELTTQWAEARGIITNGKVETQALKLVSEYGELCDNTVDGDCVMDDIGDCLVVINNIAVMLGYKFSDLRQVPLTLESYDLDESVLLVGKHLGNVCDNIAKNQDTKYELSMVVAYLSHAARHFNTTLTECWEVAYNDIKDRKGYLNEYGVFIKEA